VLPLGAAVLGMQRVRWTVRDAGSVKRTREILCRKRLLRAGENYMKTDRQQRIELWCVAGVGFLLGLSVGAFLAMSYVSNYLREAVR